MKRLILYVGVALVILYLSLMMWHEKKYHGKDIQMALRPVFSERFDALAWQASAGNPDDRYRMTDDLLESGLLDGKTVAEVLIILGTPESKKVSLGPHAKVLIYHIGSQVTYPSRSVFMPSSWFSYKDEWLFFVFFENGQVSRVEIGRT